MIDVQCPHCHRDTFPLGKHCSYCGGELPKVTATDPSLAAMVNGMNRDHERSPETFHRMALEQGASGHCVLCGNKLLQDATTGA